MMRAALIAIAISRGYTGRDVPLMRDNADGVGPVFDSSAWQSLGVGSPPTQEELDAAETAVALPESRKRRAARYKLEADPLLLAAMGYQVEYEANPIQITRNKLDQAKADYLAAKAKIRQEIP